jgi:hypothetical protein
LIGRGGSDEDVKITGLDDPAEVPAGEGGPVGVHVEPDVGGRAGFQRHPGEADQLPHRAGDLGQHVTQVELDDLLAGPGPGVADPHGGAELPAGGYLRVGDPQLVDVEVGVGAAVAEREERGRVDAGDAGTLRSTQRRLQVGARLPARTARDLHR